MAYNGNGGIIEFIRSQPVPVILPPSAANKTLNYIAVDFDDWKIGEYITIIHLNGEINGYIFRNELDRIYLHSNLSGALANSTSTLVSLAGLSIAKPIILVSEANSSQLNYLAAFQAGLGTIDYERLLTGWPATYSAFKSLETESEWKVQGNLLRWSLIDSSPEIETGSIGEKFANYTQSVVSGSGDFDFFVELSSNFDSNSTEQLIRLVQMTGSAGPARTKFFLKTMKSECGLQAELVWFSASILVTTVTISTSHDDVVRGTAAYVATGPIRLLAGPAD